MFPGLTKLLECPICFNTLSLPVAWCQQNGHTICKNCKKFVNFCPYCKSNWASNRHLLLEQILQNLLQGCRYCQQYVNIEMVHDHERKFCRKKIMQCFIFSRGGRCDYTFPKDELLTHLYDRHGRRIFNIYLEEKATVPIKNVFLTKNFCVLFQVGLPSSTGFYIVLRLYGDKNKRLLCFSLNLIQDGKEEVDQYMYTFSINRKNVEIYSYVGPCTPTFDIPEPPDRYPGGHPDGRITLSKHCSIFTDPREGLYNFSIKIQRP